MTGCIDLQPVLNFNKKYLRYWVTFFLLEYKWEINLKNNQL